MEYVSSWVEELNLSTKSTLEVGSYDENGTVRPLFLGPYIGMDIRPGRGVDLVCSSAHIPFHNGEFGVVVSTEMLEHDEKPWRTVPEMARVTRSGGYVILTARGYDHRGCFPVHDYPGDHWRYTTSGLRALLEDSRLHVVDCRPDMEFPGVMAVARA